MFGKSNHYTIVIGEFKAQLGKGTHPMKTAKGKLGMETKDAIP